MWQIVDGDVADGIVEALEIGVISEVKGFDEKLESQGLVRFAQDKASAESCVGGVEGGALANVSTCTSWTVGIEVDACDDIERPA